MAPWLHDDSGVASDPINLLFTIENNDPRAHLSQTLSSLGWVPAMGDHQFLYVDRHPPIQEYAQYDKSPSWFPRRAGILLRYHLRLWHETSVDSRIIGGVHLEVFAFGHEIISFDEAKRVISEDFITYGHGWIVYHDAEQLGNSWLDSRNLSRTAKVMSAFGRRSGGAKTRASRLISPSRDRFLANGFATKITA